MLILLQLDAQDDAQTTTIAENAERPPLRRPGAVSNDQLFHFEIAPVRPRPFVPAFARSRPPPPQPVTPAKTTNSNAMDRTKLDAIIALAQQTAAASAAAAAAASASTSGVTDSPAPSAVAESSRSGSHLEDDADRRKRMKKSHSHPAEDDERRREKEFKFLVGEFVVNAMKKYKPQMEHETFKRYAKEVRYTELATWALADRRSAPSCSCRRRRRTIPLACHDIPTSTTAKRPR